MSYPGRNAGPNIQQRREVNKKTNNTNRHYSGSSSNASKQYRSNDIPIEGVYKNPRLTYNLASILGCKVQVRVSNGTTYEGIFKTYSPELEVVLEYAHKLSDDVGQTPSKENIVSTLIISFADLVSFSAVNADTKYAEKDSFTDTGISSRSQTNGSSKDSVMRELTPWDDDDDVAVPLGDSSSSSKGWAAEEMFKHNEAVFGVKSSYDDSMHLYTTPLEEKDTPEYRRKQESAARLAAEIEANSLSRHNTELENGDEIDEEAMFSAVHRPSSEVPRSGNPPNRPPLNRYGSGARDMQHAAQRPSSQSRHYMSGPGGNRSNGTRNMHSGNKNKPTAQKEHSVEYFKKWNENFIMTTQSSQAGKNPYPNSRLNKNPDAMQPPSPSVEGGRPKADPVVQKTSVDPIQSPVRQPSVDNGQSPSSDNPRTATATAVTDQVVATKVSTVSSANVTVSADSSSSSPAVSEAALSTQRPAAVSASSPAAATTSSAANPTVVPSPTTPKAPVVNSTLNVDAKEFVPKNMAKPVVNPAMSQSMTAAKPPKSATVSVVEAKKQEVPTAGQAAGPPVINPQGQVYPMQSVYVPQQAHFYQQPRMPQRYPDQATIVQPQPHQFVHGHPPYSAAAYVPSSGSQPMPVQSVGTVPQAPNHIVPPAPTPPGTHPNQPPQQQQGMQPQMPANQHPQQQPVPVIPPPSHTPTSQHLVHPGAQPVTYTSHQGHHMMYHAPSSVQQSQQAPLQPSPHNTVPSPIMASGAPPSMVTHAPAHYYPPMPQQFHSGAGYHPYGTPMNGGSIAMHPPQQMYVMMPHAQYMQQSQIPGGGVQQPYQTSGYQQQ